MNSVARGRDRALAMNSVLIAIPASEVDRRLIAGLRDWLSSGSRDSSVNEAAGAVECRLDEAAALLGTYPACAFPEE